MNDTVPDLKLLLFVHEINLKKWSKLQGFLAFFQEVHVKLEFA